MLFSLKKKNTKKTTPQHQLRKMTVCKSVLRMAALKKGTLNLDTMHKTSSQSKATKKPLIALLRQFSSFPREALPKQRSAPFAPSYVFQHVTLRTDTRKNLLILRTAVGLACCGASSTGDSLSNQFLKPHVRNDTSIAEFAWGEGREGDKSRSTEVSFSPIFQKVLRSCTEFEEKVMPK